MAHWLSETWATAYLQVFVAVYLFCLGLPGIVVPITAPEEVRRVAPRHIMGSIATLILVVLFLLAGALAFVWRLHPTLGLASWPEGLAAASLVSLALVSILLFWIALVAGFSRRMLIHRLKRKAIRRIWKSGRHGVPLLDDLAQLGQGSARTADRQLSIRAISEIAGALLDRADYSGANLVSLWPLFVDVVRADPPDPIAGLSGATRIGELLKRIRSLGEGGLPDERAGRHALSSIMRISTPEARDATALQLVEAATPWTESLVSIALSALHCGRHLVALSSLSRLEAIAESGREGLDDLLIVAAGFVSTGPTARKRALEGLRLVFRERGEHAQEKVAAAVQRMSDLGQYDQAESLEALLAELEADA